MARLGKFSKADGERKRYTVVYSDWLDQGEMVTTATFSVSPATSHPFVVDNSAIAGDGLSVAFFVSGGDDGETYEVVLTATTSGGQVKEDTVLFTVFTP